MFRRFTPAHLDGVAASRRKLATICAVLALIAAPAPAALAVDVYYDLEDDTGTTILDKLTLDGVTHGTLQNNVTLTSTSVPYGAQALNFQVTAPPPTLDQYTNLELPGTMDLGNAFTLSAFVDFSNTGLTRLFSNYGGTGATTGRTLFDINRSSATALLRFIVNGEVTNSVTVPTTKDDPGYHHVAAVYNDGVPSLYFDGVDLGTTFEFSGGISVTAPQNLRFGEDPHDVGGAASEQLNGRVDDLFVANRALSGGEIAAIAAQGVGAGFTPAGESLAIHYSFEGDSGTSITDKIVSDGAQDGIVHKMVSVDTTPANAAFGSQSGQLTPVAAPLPPLSRVDLGALGNLGDAVTMAAVVNMESPGQTGNRLARLFGTYQGSGATAGKLVFDVDPNGTNIVEGNPLALRVILPDGTQARSSTTFTTGEDHLFAFTYNNGDLRIYLDGVEVAAGTGPGGALDLGTFNLFFGEDLAGAINEQLVGIADDLLILGRALSPAEMMELYTDGAAEFLGPPTLLGDVNNDGVVDIFDVNVVSDNWGGPGPAGDANGDGIVDIFDVNVISDNWTTSGAQAVPEPASCALALLGVAGAVALRRRGARAARLR